MAAVLISGLTVMPAVASADIRNSSTPSQPASEGLSIAALVAEPTAFPEAAESAWEELRQASAEAEAKVAADSTSASAHLTELQQVVERTADDIQKEALPREVAVALIGTPSDPGSSVEYIEEVIAEKDVRLALLHESVREWELELAVGKERERIAAEEAATAARLAAEQPRSTLVSPERSPAATSRPSEAATPSSRPAATSPIQASVAPAPAPVESVQTRVNRIVSGLGFIGLPVTISDFCGGIGGAIACYDTGGKITVTSYGLTRGDCLLRVAIAHEWKHHLQNVGGQIQRDATGNVLNRDWLEADANAFGYRYGC